MQILNLASVLQQNSLFAGFSEDQFADLAAALSVESFSLGDVIIKRGDPSDGFFILYSGKGRVVDDSGGQNLTLAVLKKGDCFGEQGLLSGAPRNATVRAASEVVALKLANDDFNRFTRRYPQFREKLEERSSRSVEFNFLRRLSFLAHLKLPQMQALAERVERVSLRAGETLFAEGEPGERAYIVRDGHLSIQKKSDGEGLKQLAVAKPGDLIGEMSLLYGLPRSATVTAASDAVVFALSQEVFRAVTGEAAAREALLRQASDRILQAETLLTAAPAGNEELASAAETFSVESVAAEPGFPPRTYPLVQTGNPVLAGLACLTMVQTALGQDAVSAADVERQLRAGQPDTLLSLSQKVEEAGLMSRLLSLEAGQLPEITCPAMVQMRSGDLVVVFAVSRRRVIFANPLTGLRSVSFEEFCGDWSGTVLTVIFVPQATFTGNAASAIFRQYLPFAKPVKPLMIWIVVLSLAGSVFGLALPVLQETLVDKVFVNGDRELLKLLLLAVLLITAFQLASSSLRQYLITQATRRIGGLLQLRFFHHILALPQAVSSKWQAGDFLLRMAENEKVLQLMAETGFAVVVDSATILVYLALLFGMNTQLALVSLGFVAGYGALILLATPHLRAAERRVFAARKDSESHILEVVTGMVTVKSLAIEDHILRSGGALIRAQKLTEFEAASLGSTIGLIGGVLQQAPMIAVLGLGAKLALEQKITTGELIAFSALLGTTLTPLMSLVGTWDKIQELQISFERTADVLKMKAEENPPKPVTLSIQGHVQFKEVCFRYPDSPRDVLTGLNLEVLPGQKVAIVGRSGSGKTSLANLLVNLYAPTSGELLVDQVEVSGIHKQSLRRQVGIVEQQPYLFSGTIRENIAKADPAAGLDSVVAAATLAGAHEFIEELPLGYDTQIGERGMSLSGGQRQRVVIARALLNRPRILILDEATSALDTESERIIQKNMEHILEGKTAFIIAHRLSTVRNADKIIVLDQGRIVESGTHPELIAQQGLYAYLNAQAD